MKTSIAAALILTAPGLAFAESWVLWTSQTFARSDDRPVQWRTEAVFPTDVDCRKAGRAKTRAFGQPYEAASKAAGAEVQYVDDGMTARNVRGGMTIPMFSASCWPVGVNPQ
jgi:hypothetical protein